MTERPREFPDPRDIHGRLVRSETKLDALTDTVNSIDTKVDALKSHIDTRTGAVGMAQHIGSFVMLLFAAATGAITTGLVNWLHK